MGFILYSYCITSLLPWRQLGPVPRREAWALLNFPPASVWRYTPLQRAIAPLWDAD